MKLLNWDSKKKFYQNPRFWSISILSLIVLVVGALSVKPLNVSLDMSEVTSKAKNKDDQKQFTSVPDVGGKDANSACDMIYSAGLKCEVKSNDGKAVISRKNWIVKTQNPAGGVAVDKGGIVNLVVAKPDSDTKETKSNSPTDSKDQPDPDSAPDVATTVRSACQAAWYNDGGDSDRETYWGAEFRNQTNKNNGIMSAEFPVYKHTNSDAVFGWYACEYDYAANKVVQITDVDHGMKLY